MSVENKVKANIIKKNTTNIEVPEPIINEPQNEDIEHVEPVKPVIKKKTVVGGITKRKSPKQPINTSFDAIVNGDNNDDNNVVNENIESKDTKKEKAKPVRGAKKIKTAFDTSYLRFPEKDAVIDFYDDISKSSDEESKKKKVTLVRSAIAKIHQILWETQQMKPETALNEVMNLMFLKYLSKFASDSTDNNKIDLLDKTKYVDIDEGTLDECFKYIKDFNLIYVEMYNASKKNGDKKALENFRSNDNEGIDYIKKITEILKAHHITKEIIDKSVSDILKIRNPETLLDVLEVLQDESFSNENQIEDLIGEVYEYFVNDYMKSKSALGQYFTPRTVMDITLKLRDTEIKEVIKQFKNDSEFVVCDKTMGTGGWLVKFYNNFNKNHPNMLLTGCEVEDSTFKYGLINILTTSGKYPKNPICGNSLTIVPPGGKIHIGTSNPPFSAGLTYATLKKEYNSNAIRFREMEKQGITTYKGYNTDKFEDTYFIEGENNTPLQILQLYNHQLKEGGMCFIVIPYGELFYKDGSLNNTRKLLLNKIDITDIIVCPGGLFTYTDTKVCMMIFKKSSSGTKQIRFGRFDFNTPDTKAKNRYLKFYRYYSTVKKEDILKEPISSLYHMDYLHDDHAQELQNSGKIKECEWVPFGDVFDLVKGELQSSKVEEDGDGDTLFVSKCPIGENNKFIKYDKPLNGGLFIANAFNGNGKCPIRYTDKKCIHSNLMSLCNINNIYTNKINLQYIYYYLLSQSNNIELNYNKGSCNQSLDVKNFNRMKIPIPSLDVQRAYINTISEAVGRTMNIENFDAKLSKLSYIETLSNTIKNSDIKELFELSLKKQIKLPDTKLVAFGDVFDLVKGELQSSKVEEDGDGDTLFVSKCPIGENNKFIKYDKPLNGGLFIANAFNGNGKCPIRYTDKKCIHSNLMSLCNINNIYTNKINLQYIYYYLLSQSNNIELNYNKGSCNQSLDVKNFNRMKIPIPPIEAQNQIVAEINEVEAIANRWKRDIEYLKNKKGNRMLDILNIDNPE
jgi:type I restriction-modification system DNA methylase subunit/restriction endonuclease S subunit